MLKKLNWNVIIPYVVLIPFFYPRGFAEYYPLYKQFFTLWLYLSAALILFICVRALIRREITVNAMLIATVVYFAVQLLITLLVQKGISEGLQRLFMAPMLCALCMLCLQKKGNLQLIKALSDILFVGMVLNNTVFCPWLWKDLFAADGHILFLGHVQVVSQLGLLALFLCYILYKTGTITKWYATAMLILSVVTMLVSDTAASKIILIMLTVGVLSITFLPRNPLLRFPAERYAYCWIGLNALAIAFVLLLNGRYTLFGLDLTLHGRIFVWEEILKQLREHWLFGYGVYGTKIVVFWHEWSNSVGMNYAHNEFLQRLLDGGIVLLAAFIGLLVAGAMPVKHLQSKGMKSTINLFFFSFLTVMLIESSTEYYYFWVFLMLMAHAPQIIENQRKIEGNN